MMSGWTESPEAQERLRVLYCETPTPVATICATLRMSGGRFYQIVDRNGWPRRGLPRCKPTTGRAKKLGVSVAGVGSSPVDRHALALKMERFVAQRVASIEADIAAGRDHDPERLGRAMAHMARSLTIIRAYRAELEKERAIDDAGAPPRNLSELRDELRRPLERIRDEEKARRRNSGPAAQ